MINNLDINIITKQIFHIKSETEFNDLALKIFYYQSINNPIYSEFINYLNIDITKINNVRDIPFLPIDLFKTQKIISKSNKSNIDIIFESSGTTNEKKSLHYITNVKIYEKSFMQGFSFFYNNPSNYNIIALLPSYLEQKNSSLVYMVNKLITASKSKYSGFFLYNFDELYDILNKIKKQNKKNILLGVSYALLDFALQYKPDLSGMIIMETGGMKGRKKEMIREELHKILMAYFNVDTIHSEYGMTELCSQAYSKGYGVFQCPSWMKVFVRKPDDPMNVYETQGALNIIDLANIYSCSFIATNDLGKITSNGNFLVLGRVDASDIRGCNQMYS
ncbi:MAG TPA: acyltransferase [Bacteroidales bacterium]|nr:acyltransferase [Bacteroidales bacterium]